MSLLLKVVFSFNFLSPPEGFEKKKFSLKDT